MRVICAMVAPVIENVPVVENVVEKHNPKVMSKVSDESVKKSVKVPIVVAVENVVEKHNPKVTSKVSDKSVKESVKVPVVKKSVKASSVVADKFDVVKDKVDVVADKASDALKIKLTGKGKKHVVGKDKDKPKNIAPDQEENPEVKAKVNVKRKMILSKEDDRKKKLKGKLKKDVSDSELETNVVDYSSDEADRKRKKLKIKDGLKRKRSGLDSSDSSEIDIKVLSY
nr:hypothetical protein [Tanacetum cinerariifolium]